MNARIISAIAAIICVGALCSGKSWTAQDRREGIVKGVFRVYVRASRDTLATLNAEDRQRALRRAADARCTMLAETLLAAQRRDDHHRARLRALMPVILKTAAIARENCTGDYCELFVDYQLTGHESLFGG